MKNTLVLLALLGAALLTGCAQLEKETGTALEDISENAKKVPENVWK